MGKELKGKEIGDGIYQQPNGTYCARFVDKFGRRKSKRSKKLREVRQWIADATYIDQHSDLVQATDMLVLRFLINPTLLLACFRDSTMPEASA